MNLSLSETKDDIGWRFENSYTQLPQSFYTALDPVPVRNPRVAIFNHALAKSLGLNVNELSDADAAMLFSGNRLPKGAQPIAQAYAGHQFGHFTMLGDGRAILLGEHITPAGDRFDIQLKGSGQTPFSRRGDGRAALAPMLREYIVSEAMHALNIPTTRSLAVVSTGEPVARETLLPGAILTRIASSHIRVGTFEYVASLDNIDAIRTLADYTIYRHYPNLIHTENRYLEFLNGVIDRQASLIAKWMLVGFVHGVMNTDNMAISGETIDYGPCAFMDNYDISTVFSSIDYHGRYSFRNQPLAAQWNLARFAETLLPLLHSIPQEAITLAEHAVGTFPEIFQRYWLTGMRKKLGLFNLEDDDVHLIEQLLQWMQKNRKDYTYSFRSLASESLLKDDLSRDCEFAAWHTSWQERLSRQSESKVSAIGLMQASNPAIIPRNHLVEEALTIASEHSDYSKIHRLIKALSSPYTEMPEYNDYLTPPIPTQQAYQTFCGT